MKRKNKKSYEWENKEIVSFGKFGRRMKLSPKLLHSHFSFYLISYYFGLFNTNVLGISI